MAKAKKYGTFSGVFTPSILTILGVIMYLRFPSIIGQAGLINTIGIIVVAHIISITTSLSVASLSTDKPVQSGGTYFMISRSLGLPIGGTLGIALFVGLSFSVSLYLIGFAESFLQYWDMEININTIRLTGTLVLIAVTTITFISTSLAIKSQYFIMVAIVLSLLSIFLGNHEFKPIEVNFEPIATAAPFMILFGIFFPAVTGFEAGVSMSGDLKDPKKSLPLGAIMAVGVGFVIYIGLAFFYAFTVDSYALVNDPQILFKISLVPGLVIAGIWGATLSSAFGSILGAPRILQAISMDKIGPKFFAKGTGKTNEPRNALLLAFMIAEIGILIGELDVIARIVSMFFITTYAFLNLASAIESWSSSDFRPAFKIPKFVSILGALSAFIVMILLDFPALVGATIVLGLLYFYLQRKELILESGDAWNSFWTNLAKRALLNLSKSKTANRNWRPNIILFSGGEKARPHLVEIGLSLTGKLGSLTDFYLYDQNAKEGHGKMPEERSKKDKNSGYFSRNLECKSVKEGIKTVTNIYGFSGFEPNTVLLGWSKTTENTVFLSDILQDLKSKMLNAIFLDYDKENGFKDKESIDIWWNGKGRLLSFSLSILRFLLSDSTWRDAKVRILIINSDTSLHDNLYRNTNAILVEKRIKAEVKVISDDFGSRSQMEILNAESFNTDLIILGLSQKSSSHNPEYIKKINAICELPGSLLLLSPSNEFEEINLLDRHVAKQKSISPVIPIKLHDLPDIEIKLLKTKIEILDEKLMRIASDFCDNTIAGASRQILSLSSDLYKVSTQIRTNLTKELEEADQHEYQKVIDKNHISYLISILKTIQSGNKVKIKESEEVLKSGISQLLIRLDNFTHETEESITIPYRREGDKKDQMIQFPFRKALHYYIEAKAKSVLNEQLLAFEQESKRLLITLQAQVLKMNDELEKLRSDKKAKNPESNDSFKGIFEGFKIINEEFERSNSNFVSSLMTTMRDISIELAENLKTPDDLKRTKAAIKAKTTKYDENISVFPENWGSGMDLMNNTLNLDIMMLLKKTQYGNIISKANKRSADQIADALFVKQDLLIKNLKAVIQDPNAKVKPILFPDELKLQIPLNEAFEKASLLMSDAPEEYLLPETIYKDSELIPFNDYNQVSVNVLKSANYFLDVLFHEPLYRDYENLELLIKKAIIESKEANSMILFHQSNIQNASNEDLAYDSNLSLFKKLLKQIEEEKIKVESALGRINHYANNYISEAFSKLFFHSIMEVSKNIHSSEREQKGRKVTLSFVRLSKHIKKRFNDALVYVLNSSSRGLVFSRKYLEERKFDEIQPKEILDLGDELVPNAKVYNSIPVFYRHLMSSKSKISDEFWVPRINEMKTIKEALKRHKKGYGGAVFLTGVHGAGKTTISRHAVGHLFKAQNSIWIDAPPMGTCDPAFLLEELKKQSGINDDFAGIFNSLPFDSVVVINDLELWWERRPGGGDALQKILDLVKLYGSKVFFMINCNIHAFNAIQKVYDINQYSQASINCSPFNARDLQQMILQRHKSSGLTLLYNGNEEENITQLSYSILFNRLFNATDGIPGIAINKWIASIRNVKDDSIEISKAKRVSAGVLYELPKDWLLVMSIFLQHKNLDEQKLARITAMDMESASGLLQSLLNAGLIVKTKNNVYTLGRNFEALITEVCDDKGLI
jgi:amino acid transporter